MLNKSLVGVAVAVAIAATATAAYLAHHSPEWQSGGPVRLPVKHGYVVRYQVGQVFTDGLERVKLNGNSPAVLRNVEISGPSADHFRMVGVMVAGPQRKLGSWEVSDGFPPQKAGLGKLVPGIGASLATGNVGSLLLVGLEVTKPGLAIRTGLKVFYTVDGKRYVVQYPASIANCPKAMTISQCQDAYIKAAE